jgi:glucose-1-phosphate adenylyltransferase
MANNVAGIIFSSLNQNTLSRLTADRAVAAIPFACRYRLVDFCLSNFVNANISNIYLIANYNYRSLAEHIGSGKDWDLARRSGGINLISPFQSARDASAKLYKSRLEALKSMMDYINEMKEEFVVLMDADTVLNIDLRAVIASHEKTKADVTFVTQIPDKNYSSKNPRMMLSSAGGKITDIALSSVYTEKNPELSLGIFVMRTTMLRKIIEQANAYGLNSLTELFFGSYKTQNYRTYNYNGYAATVSSFLDYYKQSIYLTKNSEAREQLIGQPNALIFTRVHNSAPTIYREGAKISDSMIADDCVIEGTVINSVLSRGVVVRRGAVVKDSVLFQGTYVGENASLNCVVTDKSIHISDGVTLSGNENMPFYIPKGRRV